MECRKISIVLPAQTVQDAKALAAARGISMSRLLATIIEVGLTDLRDDPQGLSDVTLGRAIEVAA